MFIIENYIPYLVDGNKAYKVSFGDNGQLNVSKEDVIETRNRKTFTYDEIIKKYNVKYLIAQRKKELEDNREIAALKDENGKLQRKIEELTSKLSRVSKDEKQEKKNK